MDQLILFGRTQHSLLISLYPLLVYPGRCLQYVLPFYGTHQLLEASRSAILSFGSLLPSPGNWSHWKMSHFLKLNLKDRGEKRLTYPLQKVVGTLGIKEVWLADGIKELWVGVDLYKCVSWVGKAVERVAKTDSPTLNPVKVFINSCFACQVIAAACSLSVSLSERKKSDVAPGSINRQIMTLYLNGFMSFFFS